MRVAVLGAGGTIAPAIVRDLAESEEVTAMRLLDLDLRRAETVAIEHGGGKAQARRADARTDLAEQLLGMEVLVNAAAYRANLAAMHLGMPTRTEMPRLYRNNGSGTFSDVTRAVRLARLGASTTLILKPSDEAGAAASATRP